MSIRSSVRNIMVTAGLASMVMVAVPASVTTAQAGASTGTWRNGTVAGPALRLWPALRLCSPLRYYGGYRRGYNAGPAVAAGLIGGLALGAIAAGQQPLLRKRLRISRYGYGAPVYYQPRAYYGAGCYWTNRRVYDAWGYTHLRRVRVCN